MFLIARGLERKWLAQVSINERRAPHNLLQLRGHYPDLWPFDAGAGERADARASAARRAPHWASPTHRIQLPHVQSLEMIPQGPSDNFGMNVALSTDGGRVAEATGDGLKGAAQIGFCLGLVPERSNGAKSHGRKHRARPGAKILGGPVRTSNFAQISSRPRSRRSDKGLPRRRAGRGVARNDPGLPARCGRCGSLSLAAARFSRFCP